jgi:hypothetical protein
MGARKQRKRQTEGARDKIYLSKTLSHRSTLSNQAPSPNFPSSYELISGLINN